MEIDFVNTFIYLTRFSSYFQKHLALKQYGKRERKGVKIGEQKAPLICDSLILLLQQQEISWKTIWKVQSYCGGTRESCHHIQPTRCEQSAHRFWQQIFILPRVKELGAGFKFRIVKVYFQWMWWSLGKRHICNQKKRHPGLFEDILSVDDRFDCNQRQLW